MVGMLTKDGYQLFLNSSPDIMDDKKPFSSSKRLPFGLNFVGGDIFDIRPLLHLHCRQMMLPNISEIIRSLQSSNDDENQDFSKIEHLDLVAPLPSHMQRSLDVSNQSSNSASKSR
ncbi:hypothetical protein ZOSMA_70G00190 [Zostera marina]|uniref:Uncharacterized protein n=1 Tax=Zostera marina TaxID=29655 RepID=A0A0K9NSN3_ZOSMR|nr:hypothetical protein ZOSMA_70G00190 [Zostera marina]